MKAQKPWSRLVIFWILLAYVLMYGARVRFWGFGLAPADIILMVIGLLMVSMILWLIVSDLGRFEHPETRRGGWRRRYHRRKIEESAKDEWHVI